MPSIAAVFLEKVTPAPKLAEMLTMAPEATKRSMLSCAGALHLGESTEAYDFQAPEDVQYIQARKAIAKGISRALECYSPIANARITPDNLERHLKDKELVAVGRSVFNLGIEGGSNWVYATAGLAASMASAGAIVANPTIAAAGYAAATAIVSAAGMSVFHDITNTKLKNMADFLDQTIQTRQKSGLAGPNRDAPLSPS